MLHYLSYAVVFVANYYTSIRIFGLGWSVWTPSFIKEFSYIALIALIAGVLAAFPRKAEWKIIAVCSVFGPATVCGLMVQGILSNHSYHLLHWLLIPMGGSAISVQSFISMKKLFNRH